MRAKLFRAVPFARSGPQAYQAHELGGDGDGVVTVDRPASEVAASAPTFEGVPLTMGHPSDPVDRDSVDRHAVGLVSGVRFDADTGQLRGDFLVWEPQAVRQVADGIRELSAGYKAEYDADGRGFVQRDIRGNHVALVEQGRAGAAVRIGG